MKFFTYTLCIVLYTALFLLPACDSSSHVNIGFYYWQQHLSLTAAEIDYLEKLDTRALYVKFFDVDWDENAVEAVPLSKLSCHTKPPDGVEIIPCVFITTRAVEKTPAQDIPLLAQRIAVLLKTIRNANGVPPFRELQIDCDWSVGTKQKYFALLTELKSLDPHTVLAVTIRLHQVKFPETTGVPPADKAVLMFYNMGDLGDAGTQNSIIDLELAQEYLDGLPAYPLHIDIALPVFSWAVLLRFDKVTKLIHNVTQEMLENAPQLEHITKNLYQVKKSFYFNGFYLYKDDILRYEDVKLPLLRRAAELLAPKIRDRNLSIIFFHLNKLIMEEYSHEELDTIAHIFD